LATQAASGGSEGKPPEGSAQARVSATLVQARQHLIRNNAAAALALLKEIAALAECPADTRLEAAKMLATAGANSEAAICYLNAGLGYLYDHGDMTKARQAFASAHNLDPHNLDVIFHLGQADVVEGRTQDGLAKFIDVLRKSNLKHTPALFEAGCIYQANGQYDQAILAFKKVLDRDKKHIQAIVHMGQLHQIKGMVPEAISYYLQAAQITRDEKQLGTTRQIANMVLAIDGNNHRARTLLSDLDEDKDEEDEAAAETPATPAPAPEAAIKRVSFEKSAEKTPVRTTKEANREAAEAAVSAAELVADERAKAATRAQQEVAMSQAEQNRKQAEAATTEAQLARELADEARRTAEIARERAEKELETLRTQLDQAQAQNEVALAQTAKEVEAARQKAQVELTALRADIERVKAEQQEASAQAVAELSAQEQAAIDVMVAKREAVQRELGILQAQVEAARKETEAARLESEEARSQIEAAQTDQQRAAEAAAQLDAELLALQGKVAQARTHQTDSEQRASSTVQELEKKAQQLKAETAAAQKRVQESEQQAAQIQSNVAKAKAAHEAAMLEIAARRQKAQAELDETLAAVKDSARQKDAERTRAELTVAELENKAEQLRKDIAAVEQQRSQTTAKATASAATLKSVEEQIAQSKSKAENANADLKDIMDQARSAQSSAAELSSHLAELQSQIEAAEGKKRLAEDSYSKVKPLVTAAERRRADAEANALTAEKTAEAARKTAEAAKVSADAAQKAADAAEKLRAKREADAVAAQAKIDALAVGLKSANATLEAADSKKHAIEEAFATAKSLTAAAVERRGKAEAAAEQAEAIRAKREADAEALAARIAALEVSLREGEERSKAASAEAETLADLSARVTEKRAAVLELEGAKAEHERSLVELRRQVEATNKALEEAQAALEAQPGLRPAVVNADAEAVVAIVPAESCVESLRCIESLAADGELALETATELASLIHEGRATLALREARKHANAAAQPAPYLLVCGDLCRDLGDIAAARDAYKMLGFADPSKAALAQARAGELFLSFAERSTAAALQRDDAHFAATGDPAKAIEAYADLVARFPEDATFREELGTLHERLGNTTAAALAYSKAMLGYLGSDDNARAVELVPRMLAVHPKDGAAFELAARAFERAGNHAASVKNLELALRSYHEVKAASDVERVCRQLTEIAEDPVPYRKELASLLHGAGDISGAAEQLLDAAEKLILWSRVAEAQELVKTVVAWSSDDAAVQERVANVQARALAAEESVDETTRGDLLVSKGQFDRAAEAYRRALDANPHQGGASYQLACLLMDHFSDYAAAEPLLRTSADLRPDHAATRYRLALVKAAQGEVVEAVELLIALARFDESNADFIEQFAERLEKDAEGGDVAAKYRLGIGYRELGRVDEALVILQSIQRQTDYVVLCHNAIGLCLRRQGLDTAAAKRFSKAIETPGYPEAQYHEALYNLGELYEAKDTPESLALALSSFEELYASDCTFKDVADRIKSVKTRMGAAERPKVKRLPTRSAEQA